MLRALPPRCWAFLAVTLIGGCECAEELSVVTDAGAASLECTGANECPLGSSCSEFGRCVESVLAPGADGGLGATPPESEQEARRPASGRRYVYVAMTDLDTVARVDSETLDITTLQVGDQPGTLVTAPGQDLAVVLNHGSDSLTVIRTDDDGVDVLTTLPTLPRLNRLEMDPLGRHAVLYFELTSADAPDVGSFQDVVVVDLARGEERATSVAVGFRPRRVVFDPDGTHAYVHTDDGVSIVSLAADTTDFVAPLVPLSGGAFGDDPFADNQPLEVVIAPDGSRAFARFSGRSFVRAVSLADRTWVDVPLAGPPSDIDLSPDGQRLVAVVRDAATPVADAGALDAGALDAGALDAGALDDDAGGLADDAGALADDAGFPDFLDLDAGSLDLDAGVLDGEAGAPIDDAAGASLLVVLPIPAALDDPDAAVSIDCAPLVAGLVELTTDGARAIVFTNATSQEAIGIVDLAAATLAIVPLRKAVSSVALSPDDGMALVLHSKEPGDPTPQQDFDEQLRHRHGLSVVDLDTRFAKLLLTEARPGPHVFTADGVATHLHVVVADDVRALKEVLAVDLASLVATTIPMSSHPTEIGSVPSSGQVFVAQRHEMGRMSFVDVEDREVRTVTGFQLNSQVTE